MCCTIVYIKRQVHFWPLYSDADPTKEMIQTSPMTEAGANDDKSPLPRWQLTYRIQSKGIVLWITTYCVKLPNVNAWDYPVFKADLPEILIHRFEEEFVAVDRPVAEDIFKIRQSYLVGSHWQFHQIRSFLLVYVVNDFGLRHENMLRTIAGEQRVSVTNAWPQ